MGRFHALELRRGRFDFDRPYLVGVVNVTPDSFSDGRPGLGLPALVAAALASARSLVADGADLLDVGGESTRPGARAVSAAEEAERVVAVIRALADDAAVRVPISVDTTKAPVAAAALAAGAEIVNDISGGLFDPDLVSVVARVGAAFVCGHVRGRTLGDVHAAPPIGFDELGADLAARVAALPPALRARTVIDPGLGFGKGTSMNVELLRRAGELGARVGRPVMVGPSRKRFLGELTGRAVTERDDATVGACLAAAAAGADFLRVHDVRRVRDALLVYRAATTAPREARG